MPLYPDKLAPTEDYAKVGDILGADDLPEAIIRIAGWKKNGSSLALRVKGLSLWQREQILKECTGRDGQIDLVMQIEATIREGVIIPKFGIPEASQLRHKSPAMLEDVATFIWTLSALSQDVIDGYVQSLADAEPAAEQPPNVAETHDEPARPVDATPVRKVRHTPRGPRARPQRAA